MKMPCVSVPHEILKNSLCKNEDIFIYDELNGVAITVEEYNGHKYYTAQAFIVSRGVWVIIDTQLTDIDGAQFMYECLVTAVKRSKCV